MAVIQTLQFQITKWARKLQNLYVYFSQTDWVALSNACPQINEEKLKYILM